MEFVLEIEEPQITLPCLMVDKNDSNILIYVVDEVEDSYMGLAFREPDNDHGYTYSKEINKYNKKHYKPLLGRLTLEN
jgi:hypothetical protein